MSNNINKKKWFKNVGNKFDERIKHVENIINEMPCSSEATVSALVEGRSFDHDRHFLSLEQLGTFLLKSSDVDTCRSLDRSFYETERDYRSRYEIGKNSYSTDFTIPENDLEDKCHMGRDMSLNAMYKILDISNMTEQELKRVIRYALPKRSDDELLMSSKLVELYEYMLEIISDSSDNINLKIFNLMVNGETESKISKIVNMSQSAVNKRISKMCRLIIDY